MLHYRFHFYKIIPNSVLGLFQKEMDEALLKSLISNHFDQWGFWDDCIKRGTISSYKALVSVIEFQRCFFSALHPRPDLPLYRSLGSLLGNNEDILARADRIHRSVARTLLYRIIRTYSPERIHPNDMPIDALEAVERLTGLKPYPYDDDSLVALRRLFASLPALDRPASLCSDDELRALVIQCEEEAFRTQPDFPGKDKLLHRPGNFPALSQAFGLFVPFLEHAAQPSAIRASQMITHAYNH